MIQAVSWELDEGRPYVKFVYNGKLAMIHYEQKVPQAGLVILDPYETWGDLPIQIVPEDDAIGQNETPVVSATNDPEVVKLWWDMHDAVMTEGFVVGPRPITKAITILDTNHVVEAVPPRANTTRRVQDVIRRAFQQIGSSLTLEAVEQILAAYRAEPLDDRHPIDVWLKCIEPQMGWFDMPDVSAELTQIFEDLYKESALLVARRFIDAAFDGEGDLRLPNVRVVPDQSKMLEFTDNLLDTIDQGTQYFIAKTLSDNPRAEPEKALRLVKEVFSSADEGLSEKRVRNINNHVNSWIMERCALDLLITLGATMKVWKLGSGTHGSHCLSNARRGPVTLDESFINDLNEDIQHPPASPNCDCVLMPTPQDLKSIGERLQVTVKASSELIVNAVSIWIDVPRATATLLGVKNVGIEILSGRNVAMARLEAAMEAASNMLAPFSVILTGDNGVFRGQDVLWVDNTPSLVHAQQTLRALTGLPLAEDYRSYLPLGPAGTSAADFLLDFGGPILAEGLRLCVKVGNRSECKFYPFLKPTEGN